jgi:DNA invertase Pin-like site-specific DNA recombinase
MYIEIRNPMDFKVALYIRLSKEDDNEKESESVVNQRSLLYDYTNKNKLYVVDEYVDDGISGTSFDRPNFNRMITDIEKKRVNMVITKDMSRLGRDYIMTGHYMERYFPENNVRYVSLLDGIDTFSDSSTNDITPFKAIMNDMYAKDISKKITSVKRAKQEKGLFIGSKAPFGYKTLPDDKNRLMVDDPAAEVVRKMFSLAFEGLSCGKIREYLNENKVTPPSEYANVKCGRKGPYSGMWSSERVSATLKNQVYIGNMVQRRKKKVSYKSKKCTSLPPEEWVIVEGTHEPIIDKQAFDTVQILIAKRTCTRSRTHDYLLKGLIYCKECGYVLNVVCRKLAGGKEVLYFLCQTHQRFPANSKCTIHYFRVDAIEERVLQCVREVCEKYLDLSEMQSLGKQVLDQRREPDNKNTLAEAESKISELTKKLDSVYEDKLSGTLSPEDFERIYARIKTERETLGKKLQAMQSKTKLGANTSVKAKKLAARFLNEIDVNKELIFSLIERIDVSKDGEITLTWAFASIDNK